MPLTKGKSPEAFKHNLKAELAAGKPMKQSLAIAYSMKRRKKMAAGGQITDNYQPSGLVKDHPDLRDHEKDSGYLEHEGNVQRPSMAAIVEADKDLNQHGVEEMGPDGAYAYGGDIVDRIMRKKFSQGGRVANGGEDELSHMADGKPNNFDDLALRDGLESSYGQDDNAGDALDNAQEDQDRHDIVARIMRQRKMKQTNPRPA